MASSTTTTTTTTTTFKIALVGDGGVGKTTLIKRLRTGEFEKKYIATLGVEVHPLRFSIRGDTAGEREVCFNMWDTAGQEKFGGLRDGYYIQSNAAIAMFDRTSNVTFRNVTKWMEDLHRVCPNAPIIMVGNKMDCEVKVNSDEITVLLNKASIKQLGVAKYYDMSAKNNYNFDKPLLAIARQLLDDNTIQFVERAPIKEEIEMSSAQIASIMREAEEADEIPLDQFASLRFNTPHIRAHPLPSDTQSLNEKEESLIRTWRSMNDQDILNLISTNADLRSYLLAEMRV